MKNVLMLVISTLLCFLVILTASGQSPYSPAHVNKDKSGLAIQGYDPVSYFSEEGPAAGEQSYQHEYNGATYLFKTSDNLKLFKSDPGTYAPQYGGWCAFAMGVTGDKVKVDPETYKIKDGMLFLFYNFRFNNTLNKWNEDEKTLKLKADELWKMTISD